MILPAVIPPDMLEMLREECSYYLGYYDSMMDAKGVQTQGISHRGKRYFINNRYRLSSRLWQFVFSDLMAEVARATVGSDAQLFHEQWVVKGAEQGMKLVELPKSDRLQLLRFRNAVSVAGRNLNQCRRPS